MTLDEFLQKHYPVALRTGLPQDQYLNVVQPDMNTLNLEKPSTSRHFALGGSPNLHSQTDFLFASELVKEDIHLTLRIIPLVEQQWIIQGVRLRVQAPKLCHIGLVPFGTESTTLGVNGRSGGNIQLQKGFLQLELNEGYLVRNEERTLPFSQMQKPVATIPHGSVIKLWLGENLTELGVREAHAIQLMLIRNEMDPFYRFVSCEITIEEVLMDESNPSAQAILLTLQGESLPLTEFESQWLRIIR